MRPRIAQPFLTAILLFSAVLSPAQLQPEKLDLNSATTAQLAALPGMGREYVRRVVAGRPYTAKNQLVTRGVLPPEEYEKIKDRIIAHRPKSAVEK